MAGRVIMAMLAKFFIFISFDAVYVYAAELFPTVIRYVLLYLCLLGYPTKQGPFKLSQRSLSLQLRFFISTVKAGVHVKAVLTSLNTAFLPISRSRSKKR